MTRKINGIGKVGWAVICCREGLDSHLAVVVGGGLLVSDVSLKGVICVEPAAVSSAWGKYSFCYCIFSMLAWPHLSCDMTRPWRQPTKRKACSCYRMASPRVEENMRLVLYRAWLIIDSQAAGLTPLSRGPAD